ncbi:MAG: hypothetical protein Q9214_001995 [Letrouitia sp. 1 TL-2023]
MAPIKRQTSSSFYRAAKPAPKTSNHGTKPSKRAKRATKHSALVSRIEKPRAPSSKRGRADKRLVADLESMADALSKPAAAGEFETSVGNAKIRRKSVKSGPGSTKKLEKLAQMEKERFNKNMAQMAAGHHAAGAATAEATAASSGHRLHWAIVRQLIQRSPEQRPGPSA